MPLGMLFAENHYMKFKYPRVQMFAFSGITLRQTWLWSCLLLTAAYTSTIKSILIKEPERQFISNIQDLPRSNLPIYLTVDSKEQFESFKYSPFRFDNWLYENANMLTFMDQ